MSDTIDPVELRDAVRPVLTDLRADSWRIPGEDGRGFDTALWQQCAELGWLQLAVPEAQGGLGLGLAHLAILYEELGRALGSVPFLDTMLAVEAITAGNAGKSGEEILGAISAGECRAAIALPQVHEVLESDGKHLSGRVDNVLFGDNADIVLLPFVEAGKRALAIIPGDVDGLTRSKRNLVDLTRSAADLTADEIDIAKCTVLSLDNGAWASLLDHAAVGIACDATGAAEADFEITLEYLKTREQFGRLIGSFQALKHRAADWKCRFETASALTRQAARLTSQDKGASASASGAKAVACDMFAGLSADAIQLHGGIGFTWEHPCHLFLKRAKLNQQLFGDRIFHQERLAELAFGPVLQAAE